MQGWRALPGTDHGKGLVHVFQTTGLRLDLRYLAGDDTTLRHIPIRSGRMSLFVLTPETVWNPGAMDFRTAPRKIMDRIAILPRREAGAKLVMRVILENQLLRYTTALLPFVIAMLTWPHLALPISQAPLPMLIAIAFVELKVLRLSKEKRQSLISADQAAARLDTLAFRGRAILAKIAARRPDISGELYLVLDQSELANVPPLTLVSVQTSEGKTRLMALDAQERQLIRDGLFDDSFTERDLHAVNLREDLFLRSVAFNTRAVTAHARLAAILDAPAPQEVRA